MTNDKHYVVVRFDWKDAAEEYLNYLRDRKVQHSKSTVGMGGRFAGVHVILCDSWNNDKGVPCETHVWFVEDMATVQARTAEKLTMAVMTRCDHADGGYRIVPVEARRVNYNDIQPNDKFWKGAYAMVKANQEAHMLEESVNRFKIIFNGPATIVIYTMPDGTEQKTVVKDINYGKDDVTKDAIKKKVAGIDWALCKMMFASSSEKRTRLLWECLEKFGNDDMAHLLVSSDAFDRKVSEKLYRKYVPGWKSNWQKAKLARKLEKRMKKTGEEKSSAPEATN